jgi:hypothetical protein
MHVAAMALRVLAVVVAFMALVLAALGRRRSPQASPQWSASICSVTCSMPKSSCRRPPSSRRSASASVPSRITMCAVSAGVLEASAHTCRSCTSITAAWLDRLSRTLATSMPLGTPSSSTLIASRIST